MNHKMIIVSYLTVIGIQLLIVSNKFLWIISLPNQFYLINSQILYLYLSLTIVHHQFIIHCQRTCVTTHRCTTNLFLILHAGARGDVKRECRYQTNVSWGENNISRIVVFVRSIFFSSFIKNASRSRSQCP